MSPTRPHATQAGYRALSGAGVAVATVLLCVLSTTTAQALPTSPDHERESPALQLLRDAVEAARTTPYKGVQFVSRWSERGTSSVLIDVKHRPGHGAVMRIRGTTSEPAVDMYEPTGVAAALPSGGLGSHEGELLRLLGQNYEMLVAGTGTVAGRPCDVIEAHRRDGSVAARYWLDQEVGLLLRREVLDAQERVLRAAAFIQLQLTKPELTNRPQAAPSPWEHRLGPRQLSQLRERGWPLPRNLPRQLSLFDARKTTRNGRPVVHLGYSDGLAIVSLFVQQGQLDASELHGMRRTTVAGHTVYVRGSVQRRIVWAGPHYVYALVADAAPRTVRTVVATLPHGSSQSGSEGLWNRLARGFDRLVSWLNPFG